MPDQLELLIAHPSVLLDTADPEALHPVKASHLKDYLTEIFGEDVPRDSHARWIAHQAIDSLAACSLSDPLEVADDLDAVAAYFLRMYTPYTDKTKALGKVVGTQLSSWEHSAGPKAHVQDLYYCFGLFDTITFPLAQVFGVPTKERLSRQRSQDANALLPGRQRTLKAKAETKVALDLLIDGGFFKKEHARKLTNIQQQIARLIITGNSNLARIKELLPALVFSDEDSDIWGDMH